MKQLAADDMEFTMGSDNPYADLGLPDADEMYLKAQLAHSIRRTIQARSITQKQAARLMGATQPKVSAIMGGKLETFTSDRLLRYLLQLGVPMSLTIYESKAALSQARMMVMTA